MWSADRSADRSRGGGLPQKQMRDNENSSRAYLIASVQTSWKPHPVRCQNATLWKLLNTDRATLASLPGRSNCRAANATISCTPPARARFGLKQLRPVASRCFSSTTLPSQHLLTSQHVCIPGHPPLHVFWLKPSWRGPQQTCTRLFFFLCGLHSLPKGTSD